MTTILTHAAVGFTIAHTFKSSDLSKKRRWSITPATAAFLALFPDFDVLGFRFGISYGDHFGHRGFTHSLFFALLCSLIGALPIAWNDGFTAGKRALILLLATASHPLLDMLTDGGRGCALFAPFSWNRYFAPELFRFIPVSPIGVKMGVVGVIFWEILILGPHVFAAFVASQRKSLVWKCSVWFAALCVSFGSIFYYKWL